MNNFNLYIAKILFSHYLCKYIYIEYITLTCFQLIIEIPYYETIQNATV